MTTRTKETQRRRRKTTSLGRVIKLPGDLVVVSRKRLERLLEDFDDLKVTADRLKEKPISADEFEKRLRKRGLL